MPSPFFEFENIIESKTYPASRLLRTSFKQKIANAFNVIAGDIFAESPRYGLFDVATLFMAVPVWKACKWNWKNMGIYDDFPQGMPVRLAGLVIGPLATVFYLSRYLLSAAVTLLAMPIIAAIHVIAKLIDNNHLDKAFNLIGRNTFGEQYTLREYLENKDIENIEIKVEKQLPVANELNEANSLQKLAPTFQLKFQTKSNDTTDKDTKKANKESKQAGFTIEINVNERTSPHKGVNIHSLFSHNIGNIAQTLEESADEEAKALLQLF